jgi:hypothetical protein
VVIWPVDVAFFDKADCKSEAGTAGAGRGGRTHTFGIASPAEKLKDCAAWVFDSIELKGGKPVLKDSRMQEANLPAVRAREKHGRPASFASLSALAPR